MSKKKNSGNSQSLLTRVITVALRHSWWLAPTVALFFGLMLWLQLCVNHCRSPAIGQFWVSVKVTPPDRHFALMNRETPYLDISDLLMAGCNTRVRWLWALTCPRGERKFDFEAIMRTRATEDTVLMVVLQNNTRWVYQSVVMLPEDDSILYLRNDDDEDVVAVVYPQICILRNGQILVDDQVIGSADRLLNVPRDFRDPWKVALRSARPLMRQTASALDDSAAASPKSGAQKLPRGALVDCGDGKMVPAVLTAVQAATQQMTLWLPRSETTLQVNAQNRVVHSDSRWYEAGMQLRAVILHDDDFVRETTNT